MPGWRITTRIRVSLASAAAAGGLLPAMLLGGVGAAGQTARGEPQSLHVDAQEYAATIPVDPYQHDAAAIHVGVAAAQETARAYVHLDVAELSGGPAPSSLLLTLTPNGDTAGNANSSAAVLKACPLVQPLEPFDPSAPPGFDCATTVKGKPTASGTWSFDLLPMLRGWLDDSNRGLAIVENDSTATATWSVAFDKSRTTAVAVIPEGAGGPAPATTLPPFASATAPNPAPAAVLPGLRMLSPAPATTPAPPAGVAPSPSGAAAGSTTPQRPAAAGPPVAQPSSAWLWWLLGAGVLAALVAAAMVVEQAVRAVHGVPGLGALRAALRHPDLRLSRAGAVLAIGAVVAVGFSNGIGVAGSAPARVAGGGGAPVSGGGAPPGTAGGAAVPSGGAAQGAAQQGGGAAGAAATQVGGAGNAAPATTASGDAPGVTATTVRIGFMTETNRQSGNAAIGASNIGAYGDVPAQARAMASWLNANGGIAGRTVIPVMENFDASNTDPNQEAALCTKFTQDDHVFAVVDIEYNPDYGACYAHAHTLVMETQTNQGDTQLIDHLAPFVFIPVSPPDERQIQVHVDGLAQQSFFGSTDKVGLIVADDPLVRRDFSDVGMPHLQKAGVANPDIFYVNPYEDTQSKARDIGTAITRMHGDGVTEVLLFGDSGGGATLISMAAAKGQGWYPKWGLDTTSAPGALETISEVQDELKNAVVVGYNRTYDAESDKGGDAVPASPQEAQCVDTYRKAGITFATRLNSVVAYRYCDYAFLLHQASLGLGSNLSIQTLVTQAMRLGSSYMSVNAYHATFNGQPYGTDGYRLLGWDGGCSCFRYTSQTYLW